MKHWMVNIIGENCHSKCSKCTFDYMCNKEWHRKKNRICLKKKSKKRRVKIGLWASLFQEWFFFPLAWIYPILLHKHVLFHTSYTRQIHHLPLVPNEPSNDLIWSKTMFPWGRVRSKLDVILPKPWDPFHLSPHRTFFMNFGAAPKYLCDNMFTHLQCGGCPLKNYRISSLWYSRRNSTRYASKHMSSPSLH